MLRILFQGHFLSGLRLPSQYQHVAAVGRFQLILIGKQTYNVGHYIKQTLVRAYCERRLSLVIYSCILSVRNYSTIVNDILNSSARYSCFLLFNANCKELAVCRKNRYLG